MLRSIRPRFVDSLVSQLGNRDFESFNLVNLCADTPPYSDSPLLLLLGPVASLPTS